MLACHNTKSGDLMDMDMQLYANNFFNLEIVKRMSYRDFFQIVIKIRYNKSIFDTLGNTADSEPQRL